MEPVAPSGWQLASAVTELASRSGRWRRIHMLEVVRLLIFVRACGDGRHRIGS